MLLEGVEELIKDVFFSLLAHLDFRMLRCIVQALKVLNVYNTVAITVEAVISLSYTGTTAVIHLTHNYSQEFIIVNGVVSFEVEETEDTVELRRFYSNAVILHGLSELASVETLRAVIVHNLEHSSQTVNATCTSGNNFTLNVL